MPAYIRFGEMIENEALPGELSHEFRRDGQMPNIYQNVVRQVEFREHCDSTQKIGLQQEPIVRFALNDMPDSRQLWICA